METANGELKSTLRLGPYELHLSLDRSALSEALQGVALCGPVGPGAVYLSRPLYSTGIAALIVDDEGHATVIFGADSSVVHFSSVERASEYVSVVLEVHKTSPSDPTYMNLRAKMVKLGTEFSSSTIR